MEREIKLVIWIDDDGKKKDEVVEILGRNTQTIELQKLDNDIRVGKPFEIPWARVLKIKSMEATK